MTLWLFLAILYIFIGIYIAPYLSGMLMVTIICIRTRDIPYVINLDETGYLERYYDMIHFEKSKAASVIERIAEVLIWPVAIIIDASLVANLAVQDYDKRSQ